jgi:fatty acid desaturase
LVSTIASFRPDEQHASRVTSRWEWPTLVAIGGLLAGLAALCLLHDALPWQFAFAGFVLLGGFHMSLLHEVLHGHPTPHQRLNEALVYIPAVVWLPYPDYRDSHRRHHHVALTVPGVDPESFYVDGATWARANVVWRALLTANRTLLGRTLLWPGVVIARWIASEIVSAPQDSGRRRVWLVHLPAAAATLWLTIGLAGVPWWMFLGGFTYGGLSLTYVRSFAEHLAGGAGAGTECAVVRAHPFWSLLFLNNNLHHTHHAAPDAAWFQLPRLAGELGSDDAAAAGAGLYRGYFDVFCRYLVRPFDAPVHPADRRDESLAPPTA